MSFVSKEDLRRAINAQCSCGGGCPDTGCVWCRIYHTATGMHAIRDELNMAAEGASVKEVIAECKKIQNGRRHALATLCGQVNGLRERAAEADRLLQDEFGGFYESAPDDEPLGRVRDMLRNNIE